MLRGGVEMDKSFFESGLILRGGWCGKENQILFWATERTVIPLIDLGTQEEQV